jgi:hypothetical protein
MKELQELRNEVLSLRNMGELTKQTESILLHKLNALQEAINYTRCCTELKCGDCDCKIKYENIGCDNLKDCKKEW